MTIYGNLSPQLDGLLRSLAQIPTISFDPNLHPIKDSFFFTKEQSQQATLGRYKALIAAAHARALTNTFSPAALFKRPGRGQNQIFRRHDSFLLSSFFL